WSTSKTPSYTKSVSWQHHQIAPGVDLQKDILDKMDFTPVISPELKLMDERLFIDAAMGFVLPEAAH
ncbi:hypothetical protein RNP90_08510, partial [Escherichia coli]|nr:hypothetical protein [Escherichia coli]